MLRATLMLLLLDVSDAGKKANILFLASDDMRPEMSPYGFDYMKTPNFQMLADDGFTFKRCYVQQALCAPSRTILLTGRRPDTSRVWTIGPYFRDTTGKDWTSLPQFFKKNGYRSIGHGDGYDSYNRSVPNPYPGLGKYNAPYPDEEVDADWTTFNDGASTMEAEKWINNASLYDEPFFLAVGFHRPHIPYVYPKQFAFEGDVQFPPDNYYITKDVPPVAPHDWTTEGNGFTQLHNITPPIIDHDFQKNLSSLCTAVPFAYQRSMKKGYYSCIQYVDHLVGVLLTALKRNNLYDSTHIIYWGDHGYKLGEHCDWFKHDNYEDSTRIPLLLKPAASYAPAAGQRGRTVEQLVEELDIYPSLIELVGLAVPSELQGESWAPLLADAGKTAAGKEVVFSQYPHHDSIYPGGSRQVMGYSMRTHEWRYTEWLLFNCSIMNPMRGCASDSSVTPQWNQVVGVELYNHKGNNHTDFVSFENINLAYLPEHKATASQMHDQLRSTWAKPQQ
eukprot:gene10947-22936_t